MKICNIITSLSTEAGGTSSFIKTHVNSLIHQGMSQSILCFYSNDPVDIKQEITIEEVFERIKLPNRTSLSFLKKIKSVNSDIYHVHGLWQFPSLITPWIAQKQKTPYIISPHGMLEEWPLNQKKTLKKTLFLSVVKKQMNNAACIHATSEQEALQIRKLGITTPIAIIPNSIDYLPKLYDLKKKNRALFLSRIHPKKGLETLINSWQKLPNKSKKSWQLSIVGNGDINYINELKKKISALNLDQEITISSGINDIIEKNKEYQSSKAFILPSHSENFGIVVIEALSNETPVLTTTKTPWADLTDWGCGWQIELNENELVDTLEKMMKLNSNQLKSMGQKGRELVNKKYLSIRTAKMFVELFEWVSNKRHKPKFII